MTSINQATFEISQGAEGLSATTEEVSASIEDISSTTTDLATRANNNNASTQDIRKRAIEIKDKGMCGLSSKIDPFLHRILTPV